MTLSAITLKNLLCIASCMIPPNAKLVFKGVLFDVYQWPQEMFDGSTQTFERLKRPDTVQVIAVVDDKLLLIVDEQPSRAAILTLPGGRVDEGEAPLAAAQRELLEETGYASDDWLAQRTYDPFHKIEWRIHYFIAQGCKKSAAPAMDHGGERITPKLVTFEEFMTAVTEESFGDNEFTSHMLRLRLDATKLEEFRKLLFSQKEVPL